MESRITDENELKVIGRESRSTSSDGESAEVHGNEVQLKTLVTITTNDNCINKQGGGIIKKKRTGGWRYVILLLVNQGLATLAFFGVGVNLVLFLTRVIGQETAEAANSVSKWIGTVYLCSFIGALLSDSYWGRYLTCAVFQLILVLGCGLLSITSWVLLVKPSGCGGGGEGAEALECVPPSSTGTVLFYVSIYMVALGYGGHQPTLATFGSDQFDESDPKEKESKSTFFSYFYFSLNLGSLFSNTALVYYEDVGMWSMGFAVSLGSAALGLVAFLAGWRGYRYVLPSGNPITRLAQVFTAALRKWKLVAADPEGLYELEGSQSAIKGARKILHSHEFLFLDKAATPTEVERSGAAVGPTNPWRICTVTQVEEAKCVLRMVPVWLCTIAYSVVFSQMASLFVEQGDAMDSLIPVSGGGVFRLPAATMSAFDILSVLATTALSHLLKADRRISHLRRMGIGLVIAVLAMIAAAITEIHRRKHVVPGDPISSLSIFWQVPQYVLVGASEVFMYVGQLEFFSQQAPDGIKSLGSSLCMASISIGNYASSLLVSAVMAVTSGSGRPGWIPDDLNAGHVDRFFFLIAGLTAVDFVVYVFCARWYKCINVVDNSEGPKKGCDDVEQA